MWKQLTAALLILAFTSSTFCRTVIVLDYYANKTAYAKDCLNKARAAMHCNGRCQMMKKLDQEEQKDQENTDRKAENKNEIQSANTFCNASILQAQSTRHATTHSAIQKTVDRNYPLLRPPVTK